MKHVKAHLLAFLTAWTVSIAGLISVGYISSLGRDYHTADPWGELWQGILALGVWSGFCVGIAWIAVALPYDALVLRGRAPRNTMVHAAVAGLLGFGFMFVATQFLPVADDSWKYDAPIAFLAAFLGVWVLSRTRSECEKDVPNRVPVTDSESQPRVPHHRAYGSVHGGSARTQDEPA